MLVFKDSIIGFVSGVQLSANDMLKVGDWIAMPKYGADAAPPKHFSAAKYARCPHP